jgi:tRNA pseudouridine13 synthase
LPNVDPEKALAVAVEGVRVIEAKRHGHKLRTGHLAGNRFTLTLRGTTDGIARARAIVAELAARGMPNYFGAQRFGARGDNATRGRALLEGKLRGVGRGERRLLASALQSELFNLYLDARIDEGLLGTALAGDVMKKSSSGGLFIVDDVAAAQARLERGEIVPTGPMFGHKMMAPPEGTPAGARESALLQAAGLDRASFAALGKLAEGTRRPLTVPLGAPEVSAGEAPEVVIVAVTLPPGAYATVLLDEIRGGNAPAA